MARFAEEAREAQRRAGVSRASNGRRDHGAERTRRSDVRAAKEVGVSKHAVRQAEHVKKADPKLFEKVRAGSVPLRAAQKQVEQREAEDKRTRSVTRWPTLAAWVDQSATCELP